MWKDSIINESSYRYIKENNNLFEPRIPLFSKVISVSYSMFDAHAFPSSDHEFNYIQCGFRDKKGKTLDRNNLISN
jgi:hypothetical protein